MSDEILDTEMKKVLHYLGNKIATEEAFRTALVNNNDDVLLKVNAWKYLKLHDAQKAALIRSTASEFDDFPDDSAIPDWLKSKFGDSVAGAWDNLPVTPVPPEKDPVAHMDL
ncbi:MAG: hypothetical protein ACFFED_09740 [Candidatus Thorarchaeota archaeon]